MASSVFIVIATTAAIGLALPIQDAKQYFSKFGYIPPIDESSADAMIDASSWTQAIEEFQGFAGLEVTGELDDKTMEMMSSARCGVPDKGKFNEKSRSKRYALHGGSWKNLTYRITKYSKRMDRSDIDTEIARAFDIWSKYTDLSFTPKRSNPVDIEIRFEENEHGDGNPFDGKSGTLAHAYFPTNGDAHFDDAEFWSNDKFGTNLFQVAVHEFGHSLGIEHTKVQSAVMAPFYRYNSDFELHSDDIEAIQALYGKKTEKDHELEVNLCRDPKIDVIFTSRKGSTIVFKGDMYYKVTEKRILDAPISNRWTDLPGKIDAAFTYDGKTYFFKGTQYWMYNGNKMTNDGEINEKFPGIPSNLDAAFVEENLIYFFKSTKYWKFDMDKEEASSPKRISGMDGVPKYIDAAFKHNDGFVYIFKNDKYYKASSSDEYTFSVERDDPPYPRLSHEWFGCYTNE